MFCDAHVYGPPRLIEGPVDPYLTMLHALSLAAMEAEAQPLIQHLGLKKDDPPK